MDPFISLSLSLRSAPGYFDIYIIRHSPHDTKQRLDTLHNSSTDSLLYVPMFSIALPKTQYVFMLQEHAQFKTKTHKVYRLVDLQERDAHTHTLAHREKTTRFTFSDTQTTKNI